MNYNVKFFTNNLAYYEALPSSPQLQQYVANYWAIIPPSDYTSEKAVEIRMLPDGLTDIVFFLDPANHESCWSTKDGRMIIGLRESPYIKTLESEAHRFGIRFLPGGAFPFTHCTMSKFRGRLTALQNVWGKIAVDLEEQLHLNLSISEKFALLEKTLLGILERHEPKDPYVMTALDLISQDNGLISIDNLADAAGTSARSLNRKFEAWIGMTPKTFCRITRFRHALQNLKAANFTTLSELALSSGYYDQSHFSNDFRHFFGQTPQQAKLLDIETKHPHNNFLRMLPEVTG